MDSKRAKRMATAKAISGNSCSSDGEWQEVRRRRPFPPHWRPTTSQEPQPPAAKPYIPYARPTYAQILLQPPRSTTTSAQPSPPNSQPTSPTSTTSTVYYVSPHSPSKLRFPPSHTFAEWRGRCFRCCRTGHSAAKCRNPKRCGKCWSFGHIGSKCKTEMVAPPPLPVRTAPPKTRTCEPHFEELIRGSYPYRPPEMPSDRPISLHCFLERDQEYFAELDRLRHAVVLHTRGFQWDLSVDNVVHFAYRTNLVKKEEIHVSQMSGSRFLIMLPEGLDPDTFINATPQDLWDEELSFQPWSPLDDASISISAYKVLL